MEAIAKKLRILKLTQTVNMQEATGEVSAAEAVKSEVTRTGAGATSQKQSTSLSRNLQSLLEKHKSIISSLTPGCQKVQCQLDQYQAQLEDWRNQHLHFIDKMYALLDQHKAALQILQQEDTRVLEMKKEDDEGEKQRELVLKCLQDVNSSQEGGPALDQAYICNGMAEDWKQKCQDLFPDVNVVKTSWKVGSSSLNLLSSSLIRKC